MLTFERCVVLWRSVVFMEESPFLQCVVSGLCSSEVSVRSMLIKEFCGGKACWNHIAIFIETDASVRIRIGRILMFSNLWQKEGQNALPSSIRTPIKPLKPLIVGDLPSAGLVLYDVLLPANL